MSEITVNQALQRVKQTLPIDSWMHYPLIVAVSGGPDSVALLRLLHQLKRDNSMEHAQPGAAPLVVAHVNHGLRGRESDADEAMVYKLAQSLDLKCYVARLSPSKQSSEEQLREQRYQYLLRLAHEQGARMIALGHQADDQVETILFRIFRGTGIGGLTGIPQISKLDETVSVIRPLLVVSRAEILEVLRELNQTYCVDESNHETQYTRNFLRLKIIPEVISRFGQHFPANLCRLAQQANEVEAFLNQQATQLSSCILSQTANEVQIDRRKFLQQPPLLSRQFFKLVWAEQGWPQRAMSFAKWQQLAEFATRGDLPAMMFPGQIRCEIFGCHLVLSADGSEIGADEPAR
jgi:tRNA(Ile)-lysidine synthase